MSNSIRKTMVITRKAPRSAMRAPLDFGLFQHGELGVAVGADSSCTSKHTHSHQKCLIDFVCPQEAGVENVACNDTGRCDADNCG